MWFLLRVLPKPDRYRYPCQQMSMSVASSYIIFWSILFSALFHGLSLKVRQVKKNATIILPIFSIIFILVFSISNGVFAYDEINTGSWIPIQNEPIGIPFGANPGGVVWVWNPNATRENLIGFWWLNINNNQNVIDEMF